MDSLLLNLKLGACHLGGQNFLFPLMFNLSASILKNKKHKEVVLLTRKLNWYKEEMFSRFVPYKFQGIWDGKSVENLLD